MPVLPPLTQTAAPLRPRSMRISSRTVSKVVNRRSTLESGRPARIENAPGESSVERPEVGGYGVRDRQHRIAAEIGQPRLLQTLPHEHRCDAIQADAARQLEGGRLAERLHRGIDHGNRGEAGMRLLAQDAAGEGETA